MVVFGGGSGEPRPAAVWPCRRLVPAAEREVKALGGTDGPRPRLTGWLCPGFESTWGLQSRALGWCAREIV